jgi:uroporphyrinogen-III synthase
MSPTPTLRGARVALLEARMSQEMATLVERHSGVPYCVPAVREDRHARAREVTDVLDWLKTQEAPVVVLFTGVAVESLFKHAAVLGRAEELSKALERAITVCRGPKPIAALKKQGIAARVRVSEPYTTHEVIEATSLVAPAGTEVLLLNYGERNVPLVDTLVESGAVVRELSLYEWKLPEDLTPLRCLIDEIIERRVSCVAFTSQIQARHLFQVADEMGRTSDLQNALRTHTFVAAIGPTCADALQALGVPPQVMPVSPKMGPLVLAIARFLTERSTSSWPAAAEP